LPEAFITGGCSVAITLFDVSELGVTELDTAEAVVEVVPWPVVKDDVPFCARATWNTKTGEIIKNLSRIGFINKLHWGYLKTCAKFGSSSLAGLILRKSRNRLKAARAKDWRIKQGSIKKLDIVLILSNFNRSVLQKIVLLPHCHQLKA
jgi:hypothetical protein